MVARRKTRHLEVQDSDLDRMFTTIMCDDRKTFHVFIHDGKVNRLWGCMRSGEGVIVDGRIEYEVPLEDLNAKTFKYTLMIYISRDQINETATIMVGDVTPIAGTSRPLLSGEANREASRTAAVRSVIGEQHMTAVVKQSRAERIRRPIKHQKSIQGQKLTREERGCFLQVAANALTNRKIL